MMVRIAAIVAAGCLLTFSPVRAQHPSGHDKSAGHETAAEEKKGKPADKADNKKEEITDKISVTRHTVTIEGKEIKYTATAGKLVMRDDEGKAKALMFFIAYAKNGVKDLGQRPVTFAFNGGPGSSSVWLHLGLLGPKRVKLPGKPTPAAPPYALQDNPNSLLDITDLVFIDPVSTGFSRPAKGEKSEEFHGYEEDLRSVGQFIHDYVTKYGRWRSPKFLMGESYGGLRAAGLSGYLRDRYNMPQNGIVLVSPALNFETLAFAPGNDLPFILFVPGYSATAWYHKALPGDLQVLPLEKVVKQATRFALTDYTLAMMQGQALGGAERNAVAEKLARYTGLSKEYVLESNLRVSMQRFAKELLRERGRTVGRYDGRYTGIDADSAGSTPEYDPSADAVFGLFTAAINDYLRSELKFEDTHVYEVLTTNIHPWDYGYFHAHFPDASNTLRASMSADPYLKLFVASGYFDLATPAAAVRYSVEHMRLPPELQKNIEYHVYEGGHMMYINDSALEQLRKDLAAFYEKALKHK
ncbi:MAG TPA: peptidase S10 [Lacipirellulaceae bacterium]|nr:peptidase S10 [Lacipirellulaceae bacterium]